MSDYVLIFVPGRLCKDDPDLWYALGPRRVARAKAICARCPYREPCLRTALEYQDVDGIWGGADPLERAAMRAQSGRTPRSHYAAS